MPHAKEHPGLQARSITFAYRPGQPVLEGVDARFAPGRVTVVIGPNGAGKSTLLRVLLGLRRPGSGTVTLDGDRVEAISARARAARLGYIPQRSAVAFPFLAREIVGFGRHTEPDENATGAAIDRLAIGPIADVPYDTLSAGQQQRVVMARAVAQLDRRADGTRFLIADEPFSAMDPRHALEAGAVLTSLAATGIGVVVVLHDLGLASRIADDAIALGPGGRVERAGPAPEVLEPGVLRTVFGVTFLRASVGAGLTTLVPGSVDPPEQAGPDVNT